MWALKCWSELWNVEVKVCELGELGAAHFEMIELGGLREVNFGMIKLSRCNIPEWIKMYGQYLTIWLSIEVSIKWIFNLGNGILGMNGFWETRFWDRLDFERRDFEIEWILSDGILRPKGFWATGFWERRDFIWRDFETDGILFDGILRPTGLYLTGFWARDFEPTGFRATGFWDRAEYHWSTWLHSSTFCRFERTIWCCQSSYLKQVLTLILLTIYLVALFNILHVIMDIFILSNLNFLGHPVKT